MEFLQYLPRFPALSPLPASSPNHPVLQQFHRLDRSSPDFHDQLNEVLRGQEYKQCVPDLQGGDLVRLTDYLDEVRRNFIFPSSPLKVV